MSDIEGRESPETYLKTIYLVNQEKGYCRSVDISRQLDISKSSVSVAINKLRDDHYLTFNDDGMLVLTEKGTERAKIVIDKFQFWKDILEKMGIDPETAKADADKFEHIVSDEAFEKLKQLRFETKSSEGCD